MASSSGRIGIVLLGLTAAAAPIPGCGGDAETDTGATAASAGGAAGAEATGGSAGAETGGSAASGSAGTVGAGTTGAGNGGNPGAGGTGTAGASGSSSGGAGGVSAGGASGAGGTNGGPVTLDVLSVPSSGASVTTTAILQSGVKYTVRASGTIKVNNGSPPLGDAEYAFDPLIDGCTTNGLDLGIDIDNPTASGKKLVSWGSYQPSHVYEIPFVGKGAAISFNYHDCGYADNSGSFTVEVIQPLGIAARTAARRYDDLDASCV
jgi:hypothetical protein